MKQLFYDAERVIRNKVSKSSEIGQDQKTLISVFLLFLSTIAKLLRETWY